MAEAIIREYSELTVSGSGVSAQAPQYPAVTTQARVTYTTAALSAVFNAATKYICLQADKTVVLHYDIGPDPTATADSPYIPAGDYKYLGVNPGDKVSCYDGESA